MRYEGEGSLSADYTKMQRVDSLYLNHEISNIKHVSTIRKLYINI